MNLSGWLTKAEAAERLGISTRSLERLTDRGQGPEVQYRPRKGNRPEPLYNPEQVQAMRPQPKAQVIRPGDPRFPQARVATVATQASVDIRPFVALLDRITLAVEHRLAPAPVIRPWLTPTEAAQYLGLSEGLVRRLIRTGRLPFVKDGNCWKVSKASCDSIEALAQLSQLKQTAADLRETLENRRATA
jgi:excisionase family DNA binding protein